MLDGGVRQWKILEMYSAIWPMSAVYTRNEAANTAQSWTVPEPYLIQQEGSRYDTRSRHTAAITQPVCTGMARSPNTSLITIHPDISPSPILEILSDQTLVIGIDNNSFNLVFFNNPPVDVFPSTLRSVLVLLRTLSLFLVLEVRLEVMTLVSYIFLFLRSHLSDFGEGYGVILM